MWIMLENKNSKILHGRVKWTDFKASIWNEMLV